MIKHIIIWTLRDELSPEEKAKVKAEAKCALEALCGNIEGLIDLTLICDGLLPSSNGDMMLDSTLESAEALARYHKHPLHVAAADTFVRPFTKTRLCIDYET
ncbi:MAG: Dabb family protein [Clostridia bacterium]|nr:Dabb family protein [Clostridia bacterium]